MRRKGMKALSIMLTAAIVLSSPGTGSVSFAAKTDSAVVENVQGDETVDEADNSTAEEKTDRKYPEAAKEMSGEIKAPSAEVDADILQKMQESNEKNSEQELKEEELQVKASAFASDKIVNVITDTNLQKAIIEAYKSASGSQKNDSEITFGDVRGVTGTLDLSSYTGVTKITAEAFVDCSFKAVKLPSSVKVIEEKAFSDCKNLESIDLPDSLTTLGKQAFSGCDNLASINTVKGSSVLKDTLPSSLETVGYNVFLNDKSLTEIIIPNLTKPSALQYADGLFQGCSGLSKITVSDQVAIIPAAAFISAGTSEGNTGVVVTFGSGLTQILGSAFKGVAFAEDSVLDFSKCSSLAGIASRAFESAENLTTVVLPSSVTRLTLGDYAFALTTLSNMDIEGGAHTGVYLPDYIEQVGSGAFYGNETIAAISLSPKLSVIPDYMFDGCSKLATVEQRQLNGSCAATAIGDCAFRGTAITDTEFMMNMNQLKTIGYQEVDSASYGIGAGVWDGQHGDECLQEAQTNIFSIPTGGDDSTNLINVKETNQKTWYGMQVGSDVFSDCANLTTVTIPASVTSIGTRAFCFYKRDQNKEKVQSAVTSITWESGTKAADRVIHTGAFQGNDKVTSIVLPYCAGDTLEVDSYAFAYNESLTSIKAGSSTGNTLPASITALDNGVFFHCEALEKIVVQNMEGQNKSPELGELLFEQCTSLTTATLPASITEIPRHCFYNAPLTTFNVGADNSGSVDKITKIGNGAFFGNQFASVDLSKYTGLRELGGIALAFIDSLNEAGEEGESAKITYPTTGDPQLKTVILPNKLVPAAGEEDTYLFMNTAAFYGQTQFNTMKTPNKTIADTIYIPDYVTAESSRALFSETGVSSVKWQADLDPNADQTYLWKNIPALIYRGCENITEAADVLPTGAYVETIGKGAFHGSSVETVTLTHYTNLTYIGSLQVDSESYNGAFRECLRLRKVTLPESNAESFTLGIGTFYAMEESPNTTLTEVNLGNVTSMEEGFNFSNCIALTTIAFPDSLKTVGTYDFWNCTGLTTVDFGKVEVIGERAFQDCSSLVLTEQNGLPESLVAIDNFAFYKTKTAATGLGKAVFGENMLSIGYNAFQNSGLNEVDFTNATALTTIGNGAFKETALTSFSLVNSPVKTIDSDTLTGCQKLTEAEFGEKVGYIAANAISGCPEFKNLRFSATTTVSPRVFYNAATVNGQQVYTAQNTSTKQVTITVDTPSETVLPLDYEVKLPYYINEAGTSNLKHILISYNDEEDSTVQEHLKLSAKLADGYFWGKAEKSSNHVIQPGQYYESLAVSDTTNYNNHLVDVIKFKTLKAGSFKFSVSAEMQFSLASGDTITSTFSTNYNIILKEMEFHPELYKEKTLDDATGQAVYKNMITVGTAEDIQGAYDAYNGCLPVYYTIKAEGDVTDGIDTYDIVVKTDRPDVLFPCFDSNNAYSEDGYHTENTLKVTYKDAATGEIVTVIEDNMYFWLAPKGTGTANITVYPEGHEKFAKTYTFHVNADINTITLEVPDAYKEGAAVGDTFSVFSSYTTFFNQIVNADNLTNKEVASNREIVYTSSEPEYVSVDNSGNVQILKADADAKNVVITAVAQNTEGTPAVAGEVTVTVKGSGSSGGTTGGTTGGGTTSGGTTGGGTTGTGTAPQINETVEDAASKMTAVVTKVAADGTDGEVKITKTSNTSAATLIIPDTVMINGVQYKVTTITANAFANNKKVKTVQIGANVINIESGAFKGCTALTKVTLPSSVETIGANAFSGCKKLKTITIPSNSALKEIGNGAFQNCKALTKITIPAKVTKIGSKAFYNCSKLKTITVKTTVLKSIGSNAFKGIHKKAVIKVPKKKLSAYKKLFKGKGQKKTVKIKK